MSGISLTRKLHRGDAEARQNREGLHFWRVLTKRQRKGGHMITTVIIITCFVAWIFLLIPSIIYLTTAWQTKFETLKAVLSPDALKLYFGQFFPSKKDIEPGQLGKEFESLYQSRYGRRFPTARWLIMALGTTTLNRLEEKG